MITTGAKYFFGITVVAVLAAFVYGVATNGMALLSHPFKFQHLFHLSAFLGPLTLGWKGAVGEHVGYTVLVSGAVASAFLGGVSSAVRDADPKAVAEVAAGADIGPEAVPEVRGPTGRSYWPVLGAFGAAMVVLGVVVGPWLFVIGFVMIGIATIEWTVRAWAERATGDERTNRVIRNRFATPLELPIFALTGIAIFTFALSRILLSVTEHVATVIFVAVPAVVLLVAALLSARPHVAKGLFGALVAVLAVVIIAAGVVGLVRGQRNFEHQGNKGKHFVPKLPGNAPGALGPTITVKVTR